MGFLTKYLKVYLLAILILSVLTIAGCSQNGNDDDDDDSSGIETVSIIGSWTVSDEGVECAETHVFSTDGSLSIFSNEEIAEGEYIFEETASSGARHPLFFTITSDNQLADCEGDTEDETGLSGTLYLSFSDDGDQYAIYSEATGGEVLLSAVRQ